MENNDKEEDFLEVDQRIPGQNYVCMSFISPENVLKKKEIYKSKCFLHYILNDKSKQAIDIREKMDESRNITYDYVDDLYENWKVKNDKITEDKFHELCDFRTSVRGVKVRGTYDTIREANKKASILRKRDPNFNIFVCQVGYWLPWDPAAKDIENQEYQEGELNNLMKKYGENAENRDAMYDESKRNRIKLAREETRRKKAEQYKEANEQSNEQTNKAKKIDFDESSENITKLRTILNEVDEKVYETEQSKIFNNNNNKSNDEPITDKPTTDNTTTDKPTTDNTPTDNTTTDEPTNNEQTVLNNFKSNMVNDLSQDDPWMKRKNLS